MDGIGGRADSEHRRLDLLVIGGNDDPWSVDDVLRASTAATFCDGAVVEVRGHEVVSSSYANRTPWHSPRELDEEELTGC